MKNVLGTYTPFLIFICFCLENCSDDSDDTMLDNDSIIPNSPCVNGFAGEYPCDGYDLMARVPITDLGGTVAEGNDSWGWTDLTTGKEYALVGTTTGTAFVDISMPTKVCQVKRLIARGEMLRFLITMRL